MVVSQVLTLLYRLLCTTFNGLSLLLEVVWWICNVSSVLIPWLLILIFGLCVASTSRFVRLRAPPEHLVRRLLYREDGKSAVANQGAGLDYPENTLQAIKMCLKTNYRSILLSLDAMTDELVILNRHTLEKMDIRKAVGEMHYKEVENIDVSDHHPLGKNFPPSKIVSLANLISEAATQDVSIYLSCSPAMSQKGNRDRLMNCIRKNETVFQEKICIVSPSPVMIYQLRKEFPHLVCGLWMPRAQGLQLKWLSSLSILSSIKGVLWRNVVAPVIGIKTVFIHKSEFNEQISDLWKGWRIRPVVYPVNSANEKRYYQRITKTQYLTDSLRTEPENITAIRT